jgi:hypothetical protein
MPTIVKQPRDGSGVMGLNSEQEARRAVRVGQNRWMQIRGQIDVTWIGRKRFFSDDAINRYLRRQTRKAPKRPAGRHRDDDERAVQP